MKKIIIFLLTGFVIAVVIMVTAAYFYGDDLKSYGMTVIGTISIFAVVCAVSEKYIRRYWDDKIAEDEKQRGITINNGNVYNNRADLESIIDDINSPKLLYPANSAHADAKLISEMREAHTESKIRNTIREASSKHKEPVKRRPSSDTK